MRQRKFYKFMVCILALIMALSATSLTAFASVWTGGASTVVPSRTSDGYYLLQSAEDLAWFANQVNSDAGNVTLKGRLTCDIYLNNVEENNYANKWTPIADYADTGRVFSGIFDGAGFTIYGLSIANDKNYQGLFGYLSGAQIKNVKIESSNISAGNNVGGIAGYSDNGTSITSCSVNANIIGGDNVGGITGYLLDEGNISYCSFSGKISATGNRIGGITGCAFSEATISQSYNTAEVYSTGKYVGGIVGTNSGSLIISCYNMGNVYGDLRVAGISGNNVGDISSCYNASDVVSISEPAGLTGAIAAFYYSSKITNCYYDSTLFTGKEDNGLAMETDEMKRHSFVALLNGTLSDFYYDYLKANDSYPILSWQVDQNLWDGTMSEPELSLEGDFYYIKNARELAWFAALVNGTLEGVEQNTGANAILSNSIVLNVGNLGEGSNEWTPIGTDIYQYDGQFYGNGFTVRGMYITSGDAVGLFGATTSNAVVSNITVAESYINGGYSVGPVVGLSYGTVERAKVVYTTVNGIENVGGVVGENGGIITDTSSLNSEITGTSYVGGIAGVNIEGSVVATCCSSNTVTAESVVGGIVGENYADISNTFNSGSVVATSGYAGGIAGRVSTCTISDCYNTGDITASSKAGGIAGQLRLQATITNTYSIGNVTAANDGNAILGALSNGTVTNSYYDRNKVLDADGNKVTDQRATGLRTTQMTGESCLDNMSGFTSQAWVATTDSDYFVYYPQLVSFAYSADYDLYDNSLESVSFLKDGLVCKVIGNTETSYFKTLNEAFDKIGTGVGTVELMAKVTITSTATVQGNVTVIPTVEENMLLRNKSLFDEPIIVKDGATLNFGSDDAAYATLTIDGNNVTDILNETFADSMVTVEDGGTLNFYDAIAVNHTALNGGFVSNNGTVNFYSGSISAGTGLQAGGVAYNKGTMNIYAVEITNNNAKLAGGVVFNAGGVLNINSGADINNNTSGEGGAFYVGGGTMNLLGGAVYMNSASYGGAFSVSDNGKLKIYDGSVYDNTATLDGAGIYNTGSVEFYSAANIDSSNDVFLPKGEKITMAAKSVYSSSIVAITPEVYEEGVRVVDGDYTAMNASLCSITPEESMEWHINSSGRLTTSEIKYVLTASFFNSDTVPYTSLEEALVDIGDSPAIITLIDDITVSETVVIGSDISFESDGMPHTISAAVGMEGPMFRVVDGAVLSLGTDVDDYETDVLYINGANITGETLIDVENGSLEIYSGTVIFGCDEIDSAVKSVGIVEMHGGKVTENNVKIGAIHISDGSFDFFAGTIFDNTGVGVYSNGTFNIHDGAGVDGTNIVYLTDGHVINVVKPEAVYDEDTGEEIVQEITFPDLIASVDFEKYYVDTQIINTENTDDVTKYAGKFAVVDTTYTLDELNYLRADNFVLKDNATIKLRDDICVYGFTLGVYTAESLELQFSNENIAVVDKDGNFKSEDVMIGTGDNLVLLDSSGNIYRTLPVLIYGDVNADGTVDGQDAFIVSMYVYGYLQKDEFSIAHIEAMDVNHDGQVTQEDADIIENMGVFEGSIEQQMNW